VSFSERTPQPDLLPGILFLGEIAYELSHQRMLGFTAQRDTHSRDEFWVLSHPAVYTQGTSCNAQPRDFDQSIPVVKTDRGGQITYHGPGQLIIYLLLDIKRLGVGPKRLVRQIEQALIQLLKDEGVEAELRDGAPGVYVGQKKIAALGLRIRKGCTYHGLSLNIDMDLTPFGHIDPCGYAGLEVTQLSELGVKSTANQLSNRLIDHLIESIYFDTRSD